MQQKSNNQNNKRNIATLFNKCLQSKIASVAVAIVASNGSISYRIYSLDGKRIWRCRQNFTIHTHIWYCTMCFDAHLKRKTKNAQRLAISTFLLSQLMMNRERKDRAWKIQMKPKQKPWKKIPDQKWAFIAWVYFWLSIDLWFLGYAWKIHALIIRFESTLSIQNDTKTAFNWFFCFTQSSERIFCSVCLVLSHLFFHSIPCLSGRTAWNGVATI